MESVTSVSFGDKNCVPFGQVIKVQAKKVYPAPQFEMLDKLLACADDRLNNPECPEDGLRSFAEKIIDFVFQTGLDFTEEEENGFEAKSNNVPLATIHNLVAKIDLFLLERKTRSTSSTDRIFLFETFVINYYLKKSSVR